MPRISVLGRSGIYGPFSYKVSLRLACATYELVSNASEVHLTGKSALWLAVTVYTASCLLGSSPFSFPSVLRSSKSRGSEENNWAWASLQLGQGQPTSGRAEGKYIPTKGQPTRAPSKGPALYFILLWHGPRRRGRAFELDIPVPLT